MRPTTKGASAYIGGPRPSPQANWTGAGKWPAHKRAASEVWGGSAWPQAPAIHRGPQAWPARFGNARGAKRSRSGTRTSGTWRGQPAQARHACERTRSRTRSAARLSRRRPPGLRWDSSGGAPRRPARHYARMASGSNPHGIGPPPANRIKCPERPRGPVPDIAWHEAADMAARACAALRSPTWPFRQWWYRPAANADRSLRRPTDPAGAPDPARSFGQRRRTAR
jgi:hypothetical protein